MASIETSIETRRFVFDGRQFRANAKPGINIARIGVLLFEDANKSGQQELYGAMSEETTQYLIDRFYWDTRAADALEVARRMPPGPERSQALKLASLLRCAADARGLVFPKRGRPRK
jgi:hypothetical protein